MRTCYKIYKWTCREIIVSYDDYYRGTCYSNEELYLYQPWVEEYESEEAAIAALEGFEEKGEFVVKRVIIKD